MSKIILGVSGFALLALVGCGGMELPPVDRTPITTVEVINTTSYPELPNLPMPPEVRLLPFKTDFPRKRDETTIKNISSCINVPEEQQDDRFWERCGENPIDTKSNIFIGFDQANWNNLQSNLNTLRENNFVLRGIITQANKQRENWRNLAEQERVRSDAARKDAARRNVENTEQE